MKIYSSASDDFDWFEYFGEELKISSETVKQAKQLFNEEIEGSIREDELVLVSISVYIEARQNRETRSIRQFADVISSTIFNKRRDRTAKKMKNAYNKAKKKVELNMRTPSPEEHLEYLVSIMDVNNSEEEKARRICDKMMNDGRFSGRSPVCVSGTAVLLASDFKAEEICDYTATGKSTIVNVASIVKKETDIAV